jgi:hypothetical protein
MSDKVNSSSHSDGPGGETGASALISPSGHRPISIRVLISVSLLNVICLALIVYNFSSNHQANSDLGSDSNATSQLVSTDYPLEPRPMVDDVEADTIRNSSRPSSNSGNIGLAPAGPMIIKIASHINHIEMIENEEIALRQASERANDVAGPNQELEPGDELRHWVQLGALSRESTARSYWKKLRSRHDHVLRSWEPRYFSPSDIGKGSLYHLRIGPMAAPAADRLCQNLQADGADCYCIRG